jgi:RHS repeat-associated protein
MSNSSANEQSYYRARYYDPAAGRFLGEDSARFAAGPNFYSYAFNSPINFADPTGYTPCPCGKEDCIPRSAFDLNTRLQFALMKLASKISGVTYYFGVQASYARTKFGFGYSFGGSIGIATDPQGNEAIIASPAGGATIGTPGLSGGIQIGAATFSNVSGFCGNSFGGEASGGAGLNVGGGYSTNSSGLFTYANVGIALGKNIDVSPKTISNGLRVKLVCQQ